jgi:tetratricopeptide (TPR) repeat protein
MGLFESLGFRGKRLGESELLEALLTARQQGDMRQFAKLCHDHEDIIVAAIPCWKIAPEMKNNPEVLKAYTQTVGMAAQLLRDAGRPQVWDALVGDPDTNPISIWQRKLKEASALTNELRYDEAIELLQNHLIDTRQLVGKAADQLQALSQGLLGHVRFNSGKVDLAVGHYEQALKQCREQNDQEGIRIYLEKLYESERYLGKSGPAADYAQELGQAWGAAGNSVLSQRFGRLSRIVRDGEPLLRVVAGPEEKLIELDEVELAPTMKLETHLWRNRPSLPGATQRIRRGKELAGKLQYDEALGLFREASKVDPYEPDAHYQAGLALCGQQLYLQAVEEYEICEALAPGWFYCRSDLWIARRLALGAMQHAVFLGLRFLQFLEGGPPNVPQRMEVATLMRPQADAVPLFALLYGRLLHETGRSKEAAKLWRGALKGDVDSDVRSRLLLDLSMVEEDAGRRRELLLEAVELKGNLIAAAVAAVSLKFGK